MTTRKPNPGTPIITGPLPLSESAFTQQIIDMAHLFGWRVAHFRPARLVDKDGKPQWRTPVQADGQGLHDLILAKRGNAHHPGRVLFWEVKVGDNILSPSQQIWHDILATCPGVEEATVRPEDWETIKSTLEGKE